MSLQVGVVPLGCLQCQMGLLNLLHCILSSLKRLQSDKLPAMSPVAH